MTTFKNYLFLRYYIAILLFLFMYSCQKDQINLSDSGNETEISDETIANSVNGIIRVKLTSNTSTGMYLKSSSLKTGVNSIDVVMNSIGATSITRTFPYAGKYEERTKKAGLDLWYDIKYDTTQTELATVYTRFSALNEVEVTEPVQRIKTEVIAKRKFDATAFNTTLKSNTTENIPFDDDYLSYQWNFNNDGELVTGSKDGSDINLYKAWEKQTGSSDVIVAVVDGGIDYDHVDLIDNMWINESENAGTTDSDDDDNGYTDDVYGYNFVDDNGSIVAHDHGTHVAGTIAARNGNGMGLCGIAGGNADAGGVKLMSCQVFKDLENGEEKSAEDFEAAIKYAADNGAVICQCSWGYDGATSLPQSMKEAIDYFIANAGYDENGDQTGPMAGGAVFFAAGNDSTSTNAYPAMYNQVIAVGACGVDYSMASYSNFGSWVDIMAPGGEGVYTDQADNEYILSTVTDNYYSWMAGTSQACPHVSGVAALIVSEYGGTGFTPSDLKEKLYQGAIDLDGYNSDYEGMMGVGLVNAAAALKDADSNTLPTVTSIDDYYIGDPDASYTVALDDYFSDEDGDILNYSLDYDTAMIKASVSSQTLTLTPKSNGLSTITITARDYLNEEVSTSFNVMIRDDNEAIDIYPNPVTDLVYFRMGENVDLTLKVEIYNDNGVLKDIKNTDISTFSPGSINLSDLSSGQYTLKITYNNEELVRNIIKL